MRRPRCPRGHKSFDVGSKMERLSTRWKLQWNCTAFRTLALVTFSCRRRGLRVRVPFSPLCRRPAKHFFSAACKDMEGTQVSMLMPGRYWSQHPLSNQSVCQFHVPRNNSQPTELISRAAHRKVPPAVSVRTWFGSRRRGRETTLSRCDSPSTLRVDDKASHTR